MVKPGRSSAPTTLGRLVVSYLLQYLQECTNCGELSGTHLSGTMNCPLLNHYGEALLSERGFQEEWEVDQTFEGRVSSKGHPVYVFREYDLKIAIPDGCEEFEM